MTPPPNLQRTFHKHTASRGRKRSPGLEAKAEVTLVRQFHSLSLQFTHHHWPHVIRSYGHDPEVPLVLDGIFLLLSLTEKIQGTHWGHCKMLCLQASPPAYHCLASQIGWLNPQWEA